MDEDMIRKVYRFGRTAFVTATSLIKASPTLIGKVPYKYQKRLRVASRWCEKLIRTWGIRLHVHGTPPPENEPGIIIANHLSYLDIPMLYAQRPLIFLAKDEIRSWPLIGWLARFARVIFVEPNNPYRIRRHIQEAETACSQGFWICFFPEGKIGSGERVNAFRRGLFLFLKELGRPIFPAVLTYPDKRLIWNEPVSLFKHAWRWAGERSLDAHCYWLRPVTREVLHDMEPADIVEYIHSEMAQTYEHSLQHPDEPEMKDENMTQDSSR